REFPRRRTCSVRGVTRPVKVGSVTASSTRPTSWSGTSPSSVSARRCGSVRSASSSGRRTLSVVTARTPCALRCGSRSRNWGCARASWGCSRTTSGPHTCTAHWGSSKRAAVVRRSITAPRFTTRSGWACCARSTTVGNRREGRGGFVERLAQEAGPTEPGERDGAVGGAFLRTDLQLLHACGARGGRVGLGQRGVTQPLCCQNIHLLLIRILHVRCARRVFDVADAWRLVEVR